MQYTNDTQKHFKRHAEETAKRLSQIYSCVLLTGPGQVGKTTLLRKVARGASYVTLDDPNALFSAAELNNTFFEENPPPVLIDKIQYAPGLLNQIGFILGRNWQNGQFYLCSSRQPHLLRTDNPILKEKLGVLTLLGLSMREKYGMTFSEPFLPTKDYFTARRPSFLPVSCREIWISIHRGSMPQLADADSSSWQRFYSSYVKHYIERDVREYIRLEDSIKFLHFMVSAARHTGHPLNLSSMARDTGVSQTTGKRWISILEAYHIVYLLKPFQNSCAKRTVRSPKLFFIDSGLAAYLTGWHSPESLEQGPMAKYFFENFIIIEILKSYCNKGISSPAFSFCRTKGMHEINLLIEDNGVAYPLVIKPTSFPCKRDITAFSLLDRVPCISRGAGGIICQYGQLTSLNGQDQIIPVGYI